MNIFDMLYEIVVIPDLVFPVSPLPNRLFTSLLLYGSLLLFELITTGLGETGLDLSPPHRKIVVLFRQRPNAMQMIRQQDEGINGKGMFLDNSPERLLDQRNVRFKTQNPTAVVRDNGKKERCVLCP